MARFQRLRPAIAAGLAAAVLGAAPAFSDEPAPAAKPNKMLSAFASDAGIVPLDDAALNSRGAGPSIRRLKGGRVVVDSAPDQTITRFGLTAPETFRAGPAAPAAAAPAPATSSGSVATFGATITMAPMSSP